MFTLTELVLMMEPSKLAFGLNGTRAGHACRAASASSRLASRSSAATCSDSCGPVGWIGSRMASMVAVLMTQKRSRRLEEPM